MPPQQSNIPSAVEGDAAGLRFDLASVLSLLRRCWHTFSEWRPQPQVTLLGLSGRELMDIGLTRGEIDGMAPERVIERLRDNARNLWGRGGM
jgi:uncharacterized protein YjiS (DUF1127 family)